MNPAVGVCSGPRKSQTGLCLEPLLQLQLCCLIMCRKRWILSIFPHLLVHQPANKKDIPTALYLTGNAVWQQFPVEICPFLPHSHSCSHLKGHEALMECAGSCSHSASSTGDRGDSGKTPAHSAGCFTTNSSCFAFFPEFVFTLARHLPAKPAFTIH